MVAVLARVDHGEYGRGADECDGRRMARLGTFRRADIPQTGRGDAAAATWTFGGNESRRRCDVDIRSRPADSVARPQAEQTESDDLEWWNDVAENLQRTRDRQNKKREAARRRLGRTEEAAEAPTATEAATRNADAPPATEAAATRNAEAVEATRATRNAAAAATEAAANRNADAPEATEAAQRHDAPRRSTEPPTEEYQRDREQKKEAARRRIAEARAAKQAAVAAENAMKERAAADENRRQRRFDAAYAQILAAEQAVVANEFARVRSEAPSEDSRAALDALDRVAAVAREKALSEPTPPRPARLSRKTTDFVAFDAQRNWS